MSELWTAKNTYSLIDIAEKLKISQPKLRGFADKPGMRELLATVQVRGFKGVRYTDRSIELLEMLMEAQDDGKVQPVTAAAWLRSELEREERGDAPGGDDKPKDLEKLPPLPTPPNPGVLALAALLDATGNASTTELAAGLIESMNNLAASQRDLADATRKAAALAKFYTLAEAAEVTGLSKATIRAYGDATEDGGRIKYAGTDLQTLADRLPRREGSGIRAVRKRRKPGDEPEVSETESDSQL